MLKSWQLALLHTLDHFRDTIFRGYICFHRCDPFLGSNVMVQFLRSGLVADYSEDFPLRIQSRNDDGDANIASCTNHEDCLHFSFVQIPKFRRFRSGSLIEELEPTGFLYCVSVDKSVTCTSATSGLHPAGAGLGPERADSSELGMVYPVYVDWIGNFCITMCLSGQVTVLRDSPKATFTHGVYPSIVWIRPSAERV